MNAPTRTQAQGAIIDGVTEDDEKKDVDFLAAERVRVEIDGRKQFFTLQKGWSTSIIVWISVLIAFNALLTVLVGAGVLSFETAPWFVTAVTVETFLQVVGLGYVAARYLFSNDQNPSR
ncbi:hypothetical protein [Sphingopyxis sp. PET50]|uniref:hypothetical protein n=1 Tax=Sphingopyxis sp. PET50 TaxID=2976533 RepID=UPI0021AEAF36|nr:hypothetical protein [Sphingopyxis sp. PET50]